VIWVFDYFLCSSYRYIIYTHLRSNLCHSNVSSTYHVSNLIFDREKSIRYSRPRIYNVWEKSSFQIRHNYPVPVGFLPQQDFCQIWKKWRIPARAGAEIRYSPRRDGAEVTPPCLLCLTDSSIFFIFLVRYRLLTMGTNGVRNVNAKTPWQARVTVTPISSQKMFRPIWSMAKPKTGEATAEMK